MEKLGNFEFYVRFFVIIIAALTPLIFLLTQGHLFSLSQYWETSMQPLFIVTNAVTSYYLYGIKSWKPSAIFLLLLTAFSVSEFPDAHNILAVLFFVVSLFPLYLTNHYKYFFWVYLGALPIMIYDMMLGESIAVAALCTYHGLILLKIYKLERKNGKNCTCSLSDNSDTVMQNSKE